MSANTEIEIMPYALPRLSGGTYTATFEVKVGHGSMDTHSQAQKFYVAAPRFALPLEDIKGRYPAHRSAGAFANVFPHITFQRKTTPWERDLLNSHAKDPKPWMTLLLLDAEEMLQDQVALKSEEVKKLGFPETTANEIGPKDAPNFVQLLTLPRAKFNQIFAGKDHFHKLAHVRKTSTEAKEHSGQYDDGEYAVLVCNRLPKPNSTNHMFLVSLERAIEGDSGTIDPVKLVVLHTWEFQAKGADFATLVQNMQVDWLHANPGAGAEKIAAAAGQAHISSKQKLGYVPMYYEPNVGKATLAWYRGPLIPFLPELNEDLLKEWRSFRQLDKTLKMLDITYAAAFELGKMLALQNQGFLKALHAWENKRESVEKKLEEYLPQKSETSKGLEFLRENEILQEMLLDYWQSQPGK